MEQIFEKVLTQADKGIGLKIRNGASLLPPGDADLYVKDASRGRVLQLEYKVSGKAEPIIRGRKWLQFIRSYPVGATVRLYTYDGSDADYIIEVTVASG